MYEHLLYSCLDGVCRITLNRPHVYNALSPALLRELNTAFETAGADDTVRVVVLTGAGDKAFSSGADLKETPTTDGKPNLGDTLRTTYNPLIRCMRSLPKPIIARVNGIAAGAGSSLALACDLVICTDSAYFSQIFVNIGLMPDAGATFFLPRLLGPQLAFELSSTGRRVYGPEATRIGLVNRSVPVGELDEVVNETVAYYASAPTRSIAAMKKVFNQSLYSDLDQMLEQEADNQNELGQSADFGEGLQSFLGKRPAKFSGK
ncbi:enoyl-CoA hydratase/isomerase family protein [Spirosoma sp. KUDC1026]|uniref:enoyl-CoA hydratase/isomerase family protein n=1 Tax=Spirosoma sp. KUDC1026 TaxID=2745947 RepID=UPI00159BE5EB|nr:enoyl-CoA hydratase-related protein [Spirosoma sp. KUDC1026]QKZ14720.1 enoyl-CoA hydratase/isomerase family protein [Spirosoma sp. KUDC1026]